MKPNAWGVFVWLLVGAGLLAGPVRAALPPFGSFVSDSTLGTDDSWFGNFLGPGSYGPVEDVSDRSVKFFGVRFGKLHIAGQMTVMDGDPVGDIAVWEGDHWESPYPDFPGDAPTHLFEYQGELWAYRRRDTDDQGYERLYALKETGWSPIVSPLKSPRSLGFPIAISFREDLIVFGDTIARWDGSTWTDLGANVNPISVRAIAVYDDALYAAGFFAFETGGTKFLIKWDGETWTAVEDAPRDPFALLVWDGKLVVGGGFETVGQDSISGVALWDGESWGKVGGQNTEQPIVVTQLGQTTAGDLYVVGGWNIPSSRVLAKWTGAEWEQVLDTRDQVPDRGDLAIAGDLVCFGGYDRAGTQSTFLASKLEGGGFTFLKNRWPILLHSVPISLLATSRGVYAGGEFVVAGEWAIRLGVGFWDGESWSLVGEPMTRPPSALALYEGDLIAGGGFDQIGEDPIAFVARFDGAHWQPMDEGLGDWVYSLHVYNGRLVAGGTFVSSGRGEGMNSVAAWDGKRWQPLGGGVRGSSSGVLALDEYHGKLIAAGRFSFTGPSVPTPNIAQWDGKAWRPIGNLNPALAFGYIQSLAVANDRIYVFSPGGVTVDGDSLGTTAQWDGDAWSELDVGSVESPYRLASHQGRLVVGGRVSGPDGGRIGDLVEWDGEQWLRLGSGITWGLDSETRPIPLNDISVYGRDLYLSGGFQVAGGKLSTNMAHWRTEGVHGAPKALRVHAYPNPVSEWLTLSFSDLAPGPFSLKIYDIQGRLVRELATGPIHTTAATYLWDLADQNGNAVAPGVYFARARSGSGTSTRKLVVTP